MRRKKRKQSPSADWSQILIEAVNTPGIISSAYSQFWNYSVGNQLLAIFECMRRGLQLGPINTFKGWLALARYVKKGEKALTLCMPVTVKRKPSLQNGSPNENRPVQSDLHVDLSKQTTERITVFVFRPRWFVLSQTEGKQYVPTELPEWSEAEALRRLKIEHVAFDHSNGNCQGFARLRQVAISPIAHLPHATLFHEMAHVVLKHTVERPWEDHDRTPRSLREVEAECVALICCESLKMPGIPGCRGYIQHWLQGKTIPDSSAQKIFKAADEILKAGCPARTPTPVN